MKRYLVVFKLPAARAEHAHLKTDLAWYSGGDMQIAFSSVDKAGVSVIGFLFTSDLPIAKMDFEGHLFREDSYLLLELGDRQASQLFGDAMGWLYKRRPH